MNIMQGKNEVMEFLSGKVFFISLGQITFMFLACFLCLLYGKHEIGLQLLLSLFFIGASFPTTFTGWKYLVT